MKNRFLLLTLTALLTALASCLLFGGYIHTHTRVLGVGGVWYILPGPHREFHSYPGDLLWRTRYWTFRVLDKHVLMNGRCYGAVSSRDEVEVTWNGEIIVNGIKREEVQKEECQREGN
jgi:hypothetical protein